jgi:hypothetical protein
MNNWRKILTCNIGCDLDDSLKLIIFRSEYTHDNTFGRLETGGVKLGRTTEHTVRAKGVNVYGKTAIEQGGYELKVIHSARHGRELPMVIGLKNTFLSDKLAHNDIKVEKLEEVIKLINKYERCILTIINVPNG